MIKFYEHFTDISKDVRYDLITALCFKERSRMPETALKYDPPCAVDMQFGVPAGWALAALTHPGKAYLVMTYVAPRYRRIGIGTKLVKTLLFECGSLRLPANTNRGGTKFYRSVLGKT